MRFILSKILVLIPGLVFSQLKLPGIPRSCFWENQPLRYQITSSGINIESGPKTDWFRDPNITYNTDNAPKLLFTADENFVIKGSLKHSFKEKWDGGALVLKGDSLHWIKFCFEKDYLGMHRVVTVVTNDISDDCNAVALPGDQVFYKMAKSKNVITMYYSTNAKDWILVRHLQFNFPGPLRLGWLAQSPEGKNCQVSFDHWSYSDKAITDPYKGE